MQHNTYSTLNIVYLSICNLLFILLLSNCSTTSQSSTNINIPANPHERLSQYNFFVGDIENLNPADGVLPYDLNSPLFSDYSHKSRFVWMPDGTTANYTTEHVVDFPIGAVLIKNFYYLNDERDATQGKRLIETRLLVNRGEEWDAYGYSWNEEQTDATYDIVGDIKEVAWVDAAGESQKIDYIIPNQNQCKGCHAHDNVLKPIGPKVRNLNKDFVYADGLDNQLEKWSSVGYLTGLNDTDNHPAVARWDDQTAALHDRSMAYLDINCGHCHNPKGAGGTSGLSLLADSELGLPLGIYKPTVSAGAGTGGHTFSIFPGKPDESIMIYRMESLNPGAMMPELGRRMVHKEGVALISNWIQDMDRDAFTAPADSSLN